MKKWLLFLSLYICLCLSLGACGETPPTVPAGSDPPVVEPLDVPEPAPQVTGTFRVVGRGDALLLAESDGGEVYCVPDGAEGLVPGALVDVAWGGDTLETYPVQFGGEASVTVRAAGFDDRCRLYLDVLEDLWSVDEGLNNGGMKYVGVDLSRTSLTESERSTVAWVFAQNHGVDPLELTYEELMEQGYLTGDDLEGTDAKFWHWENGCLFSIAEEDAPSGKAVFDAQKWRSGLGAYYFSNCAAAQLKNGSWGGYTVESEAIS